MFDDSIDTRSLNVTRVYEFIQLPFSQRYANAEHLSSIFFFRSC